VKVLWTNPAAATFNTLRPPDRQEIAHRVRLLSDFPEMYPVRLHQPYAGFRYFFTRGWCVSYTMAEDTIIILAIFPARVG